MSLLHETKQRFIKAVEKVAAHPASRVGLSAGVIATPMVAPISIEAAVIHQSLTQSVIQQDMPSLNSSIQIGESTFNLAPVSNNVVHEIKVSQDTKTLPPADTQPRVLKEFAVYADNPIYNALITGENGEFVVLSELVKAKDSGSYQHRITAKNTKTGKDIEVTTDGDSYLGGAYGKHFVYSKGDNGRTTEIHGYDLEEEKDYLLDKGTGKNDIRLNPNISEFNGEPIAVWTSYEKENKPAVYGFTPSKGKFLISPAAQDNASNIKPVVSGDIVSWNKGTNLVFYDLSTQTIIAEVPAEAGIRLVNPSISPSGDIAAYKGDIPIAGQSFSKIFVGFRNTRTQKEVDTGVNSVKTSPIIVEGNRLFFGDNRDGNYKVRIVPNLFMSQKSQKLIKDNGMSVDGILFGAIRMEDISNEDFDVYSILSSGLGRNQVNVTQVSVDRKVYYIQPR